MKTAHETPTADRLSTHEELHQVLALLNDPAASAKTEIASDSEDSNLREALFSLWQDAEEDSEGGEHVGYGFEESPDEECIN